MGAPMFLRMQRHAYQWHPSGLFTHTHLDQPMIYTHAPSQAVGLLADSNLGPKEAVQNMLSRGILDSMAHVKVLVLRGVFLRFSAVLDRVGSISGIFGGRFSPFCCFSNFVTRYTRTENPRLMYSPSPTRVKAPQLGPEACCFYFCVFGR
jgi:hypothetical protein